VEVEAAERTRVQSAWLLTGGLDWSRLILRQDALSSNEADHLAEPWAVPLAESRLSTFLAGTPGATDTDDARSAFLSGSIVDLQSRMNIGNLVIGGVPSEPWRLRFERLFQALGLPETELDRLVQGMLAAYPRPGTAAAPDAPLPPTQMDQLVWLGLSPSTIAALQNHAALVSMRQALPVNVNTASAEVIYATAARDPSSGNEQPQTDGLDLASARALVEQRDTDAYRNLVMARYVLNQLGKDEDLLSSAYFSVRSDFFEVRGRLRLDELALEEVSTLQRTGSTASVLARRRTTVTAPEPGGLDWGSMQSRAGP
jgi:general secretion pathway protein K